MSRDESDMSTRREHVLTPRPPAAPQVVVDLGDADARQVLPPDGVTGSQGNLQGGLAHQDLARLNFASTARPVVPADAGEQL